MKHNFGRRCLTFTLATLVMTGCLKAAPLERGVGEPLQPQQLASGDQITQDSETGEKRSIPPMDPTTRPVDRRLSETGRWLPPFEGEVAAVSMTVLPDRRVLYWDGAEENGAGWPHWPGTNHPLESAESRILDFSLGAPAIKEPAYKFDRENEDIFCSGFTVLPDGRVLSAGGSYWFREGDDPLTEGGATGLVTARVFNPDNDTWTNVDILTLGRWYPTLFLAPDGQAIAASGIGFLADPRTHWDNFERYAPESDAWSVMQGTKGHNLPLYPHLHVLPGGPLAGHAFFSASGTMWGPAGEHPQQGDWRLFHSHDLRNDEWSTYGPSRYGARGYASTVLLPGDPATDYAPTIISAGGTVYQGAVATSFTEIIDASTSPPTSREGPRLHHARWHHQAVLLPDGTALVIGGGLTDSTVTFGPTSVPIMEAELFDPRTEAWRLMAAMSVERMYHSTAALLPDGRVLVGGHVPLPAPTEAERTTVRKPVVETRFEIFEPGYLFRGERPVIRSAPTHVPYGKDFFVEVDGADAVVSVMLMRPAATTHAWDANQRGTYLEIVEKIDGGIMVRAPPNGMVSQPGAHMLFVNKAHPDGAIPSVAAIVHVGLEPQDAPAVIQIE